MAVPKVEGFKVPLTVKSSAPNSALHIQIFCEQGSEIITSNWDTGLLSYSCRAKLGYLEMNSDWELHRGDSQISVRSDGTHEDSNEDPMKNRREQGSMGASWGQQY